MENYWLMSRLVYAVEEISLRDWIFYIATFGPLALSLISIVIAFWASRNSEETLKRIATAEERLHNRKILLDAYTSIIDHSVAYYVNEGLYRLPTLAKDICADFDKKRSEIWNHKNRVRLLLMKDDSVEAKNLLKAIDDACNSYVKVTEQIKIYIANGACLQKYISAMSSILRQNAGLTEAGVLIDPLLRQQFMQLTGDKLVDQYLQEFVESTSDDNLDIYFKKYIDSKLS